MKGAGRGSLESLLREGIVAHQAGNVARAEKYYDDALALDPNSPDAAHLKGVALVDQGKREQALLYFDRAIIAAPRFADVRFNKANALAALERADDAIAAYTDAITLRPEFAEARLNLGSLLLRTGRGADAVVALRALVDACPNDPRGYLNLAISIQTLGGLNAGAESMAVLQRAAALAPRDADIQAALGTAHLRSGDNVAAATHLKSAIALPSRWPDSRRAEIFSTLGEAFKRSGSYDDAISSQRRALELAPENQDISFNFASALQAAGKIEDAEREYAALLRSWPGSVRALINLGGIYRLQGRSAEAGTLFEQALTINAGLAAGYANLGALCVDHGWLTTGLLLHDKAAALGTDDAAARFRRSINLLALGRLRDGWEGYDERFDSSEESVRRRVTPPAYWRGEPLAGKRLLLWTEQGLGDEILHGSMLPDVLSTGAHCLIECSLRMAPVFARSFPAAEVVGVRHRHEASPRSAEFDYQISVASLGRFFRPKMESFPNHTGYLKPDRERVASLRTAYQQRADGRKVVGLSWRSRNARLGPNKSAQLLNFAPLLRTQGIMFVNLQYGDCAAEIAEARDRHGADIFEDPAIDSMADVDAFFAQVCAMDLVVTTSNTTAHVAGSMNVPVWVMLPVTKGVLWYWFDRRDDSPWYPSARLIRARTFRASRSWESETAERAAADLAALGP